MEPQPGTNPLREPARSSWPGLLGVCLTLSPLAATEANAQPAPTTNAPPAAATNAPPVATTNAPPAAATNAPPAAPAPLTPEEFFEGGTNIYANWLDLTAGGLLTRGNQAQAESRRGATRGPFGGIEDFHYQSMLNEKTALTLDGRALFDLNDYKFSMDVRREELGFLRLSYNEFRTWSNGDGGYYRPGDLYYPLGDDALALDRGEFSFAGGLTMKTLPEMTFKYTRAFREGEKGSTIWGVAHPAVGVSQALSPSFYDIKEHSDAFQFDLAKTIKATDLGIGVRYEDGELDNALKITQSPGEPVQQRITDRQDTTYNLFNVHAFTETWVRTNLLLSSGFSYADLNNDFSGSRVSGSDFDAGYTPSAQNGLGYHGLDGDSSLDEYVVNLNLMYKVHPTFTVTPSMRFRQEVMDARSRGYQTLGAAAPVPVSADSDGSRLDVRERLDFNYTGLTNSTLYARGEWTQGSGSLTESGGLGAVNGIGVPPVQRETDDSRFFQKYSAGLRWYPTRRVVVDVGGDYRLHQYDYDQDLDSTPNDGASPNRYPAYLTMQDLEAYGGKVRVMLRPLQKVTLASRYEYQQSSIHTGPASESGLADVESSDMNSHIFAQDISWTPWSRLNLQAGLNFVWSTTTTPASDYTQAVLDAQNNYWTVNFSSTFVLDDKTDLNIGYLYYRADNYEDNSQYGVPYGAGAQEHSVTVGIIRRLSQHLRVALRYGYYHYTDDTFGGNQDYEAHVVSTSLRYLF